MKAFLLEDLLKRVSRSFYLTLRVLPRSVRDQIGLAYLLARTSDTIADTEVLPAEQRLDALSRFRLRMAGRSNPPLDFGAFMGNQGSEAERTLLELADRAIELLAELAADDQAKIKTVIETIISGQELDLRRFVKASVTNIVALRTASELDDYTYRVAGCVGEFWTQICRAHVFPRVPFDDKMFLRDGIRFGKGLQLVNILRDIPADLQNGRCYLPEEELAAVGLAPGDLLRSSSEGKLRPIYDRWLDVARGHLEAGWGYTNTMPMRFVRVRLACAWPVLIGLATLSRLRAGQILYAGDRIKVSRSQVRRIIVRTILLYPFESAWTKLGRTAG